MPNKQLTAKVRLNTTQAEKSIENLVKKINKLDNAMNKANSRNTKVEKTLNQSQSKLDRIVNKTKQWATEQNKVNRNIRGSNNALGSLWSKLRGIAATYLGIMGTRAVLDTTDTLVGAQNRLNYVNANQLGDSGYTKDGTYSADTLNLTADAMDKMYASSQKARTSYEGMMANVSKTMMLAGDAFHNNIDNAIRFQEIMAEAYAVGGASAQEQNNSMYQLTQALGSGILQGDELRSVREGAPLAYKAIEEFAQGVLNTTDSLKDLASQGKITSEMVVAAVMNMGSEIDAAFAQTKYTFGQFFDQIKNAAVYAFKPVMEQLTDALNKAVENGAVQKFESLFTGIAKAVMIAFKAIEIGVNWIADNWYWLQYVFYTVIAACIAYLIKLAAIITYNFLVNNPFIIWIIAIGLLVAALVWMLNACETGCQFIIQLAIIVAQAIIGVLAVVLAVYLATGTIMLSIPTLIALCVVGVIAILLAVFLQFTGEIIGGVLGIYEVCKNVCSGVGQWFKDLWNAAASDFWNFIADMVEGFDWLSKPLSAIAKLFGKEFDPVSFVGEMRAKANAAESKLSGGSDYFDISGAWNTGYSRGYEIGTGIQDKINGYADKVKNFVNNGLSADDKTSTLDKIGEKLGLDFSDMGSFPTEGAGSGYSPDLDKLLGGIGDDTSSIADSMNLTNEDLEYLRRIADMEWKKEYTTAEIKVEMNNNNQINGDGDLDGIVTRLADKLYEEMNVVANGVYAY